jgi:uncharacterized protein
MSSTEVSAKPASFPCTRSPCKATFDTIYKRNYHVQKEHGTACSVWIEGEAVPGQRVGKLIHCAWGCGRTFASVTGWREHVEDKHTAQMLAARAKARQAPLTLEPGDISRRLNEWGRGVELYTQSYGVISGVGVLSRTLLRVGQKVVRYTGTVLTSEAFKNMSDAEASYVIRVGRSVLIDGSAKGRGNEAARLNHSCDPNCYFKNFSEEAWVVPLKPILPGTELTADYNRGVYGEGKDAKMRYDRCDCKESICKARYW